MYCVPQFRLICMTFGLIMNLQDDVPGVDVASVASKGSIFVATQQKQANNECALLSMIIHTIMHRQAPKTPDSITFYDI